LKDATDEQLMNEVASGNLDALKFLFERYHIHLYNFLYKMSGDIMLSEDITQEVFYKLMKYRASYRKGRFASWMFTIARNSLATHFSRNKEKHDDLDAMAYRLTEKQEDRTEDFSQLQMALSKLEASDRELLILNRIQEIKYKDLSEIVGSTPGAVKTKVSRALKKLRVIYFENI